MATINVFWPEARLIVVCIPKVANSAIKHALLASMGYDIQTLTLGQQLRLTPWAAPQLLRSYVRQGWLGREPGRRFAWHSVHTTPLLRHVPLQALRGRYRDWLKVGFVRHPLDRLVSCYRSKIAQNAHRPFRAAGARADMAFGEFCDMVCATPDRQANRHFRSQHCFLYHSDGELAVDMLGHFETLEADWQRLQARVAGQAGVALADLPRANATHDPVGDWRGYFDGQRLAEACARYRTDFERFGYSGEPGG